MAVAVTATEVTGTEKTKARRLPPKDPPRKEKSVRRFSHA